MFGGKKDQPLLFMRSGFGLLGLISLFYAVSRAAQADVTIISKLSPFLITLFAYLFLERADCKSPDSRADHRLRGSCSGGESILPFQSVSPVSWLSCGAIFSSVAYTLLAYSKDKVNAITIIMHFSTFCVVASLPFFIHDMMLPSLTDFMLLVLIGVCGGFGTDRAHLRIPDGSRFRGQHLQLFRHSVFHGAGLRLPGRNRSVHFACGRSAGGSGFAAYLPLFQASGRINPAPCGINPAPGEIKSRIPQIYLRF